MRIPIDYYRILGLPIQATADQLQQAHRDRTLQLPRREYSDAAIAARRQLLDEAYAVLSDPSQRQTYDATFLATTYDLESDLTVATPTAQSLLRARSEEVTPDAYTPSIEIREDQLIGALLILQELGEYELVLRLGRPYLSGGTASLRSGRMGQVGLVKEDIVLTVALACLELGREQWQQGQYENAAEALETGQELLLREALFPSVRGEIQSDLYKLRPYRILELLALPEENVNDRQQGLQLLRDMLQERGGIDGGGNDQSGLNIDDFLRFIQQLRSYLTAADQQLLFEAEANRPSAVATYLAVYALLARGFAEQQPALVRRAKLMLMRLSSRQDVHLEQAVCCLLLGQTEEASRALELSQEYEPLAFIREHSQGAPDLLPGLCLYGERWLQDEVFPHFRDLVKRRTSLKEYFADEQVQAYLEALPAEPESQNEWTVLPAHRSTSYGSPAVASEEPIAVSPVVTVGGGRSVYTATDRSARNSNNQTYANNQAYATGSVRLTQTGGWGATAMASDKVIEDVPPVAARTATATLASGNGRSGNVAGTTMPAAERVGQRSVESEFSTTSSTSVGNTARQGAREGGRGQVSNGFRSSDFGDDFPPRRGRSGQSAASRSGMSGAIWLILLGLLLVGAAGFLITRLLSGPKPLLRGEYPMVSLDRPIVDIPSPAPTVKAVDASGPLTQESAQQVIQTWLTTKAAALGSDHQIEALDQILTEPMLAQYRARAEEAKRDGWYWKYEHTLKITSVKISDVNPDLATVDAEVTENAQHYEGDNLKQELSYNDENLPIQYELIRKDNRWLIQDVKVLQ
ncbi:MAG: DUF4101 domain-containing protein [Scytolyngbya sp. HA4215-MV1]|nr:DUF4101 domain-containing protein [Scytolyngbya sp. HA4215-MV1]